MGMEKPQQSVEEVVCRWMMGGGSGEFRLDLGQATTCGPIKCKRRKRFAITQEYSVYGCIFRKILNRHYKGVMGPMLHKTPQDTNFI